jgi:hypothetical protein
MKKFFTCLGVVFALIIVVLIIVFAIFIPRIFKLDGEATAYIQNEVPKIVAQWDPQELIDRGTPELVASAQLSDDPKKFFSMCQKLGSLKHLDTPLGRIYMSTSSTKGSRTIGNYTIPAEFEKGAATITIRLFKVNDTWKIDGFYISSEVLLPSVSNQEPKP